MNVDLLERCAELVDIPSVSHDEAAITDHLEGLLANVPWLTLDRVGHNLVARTDLGREMRLVLAGHTDTVPPNGNARARREGDVLWGLGSADMKSGVTVLLELARSIEVPSVDVTYVFYECEEVDSRHNGLNRLLRDRPDLLTADAAVLAEPTGARIEAGCQGTLRARVTMAGVRAHTARPWMGRNAIHRLGEVLARVAAYEGRRPVLDGCEYREALQAVRVSGGVATNVVPDEAIVELNHRFAPDRTAAEAEAQVREVVGRLDEGDTFELLDSAPPAPPSLVHPLLARLAARSGQPPRAKLGWTDVAFFASRGVPATNFGPGDPAVAHSAGERVERAELEHVFAVLQGLLAEGT
ncbi:MAG: succinyl-diaminopimelate desuccinylase [Actinomycetota bacterium]|nr:succinyl-diaminopimelate desuccinylase [Actinomycetota bacterium]